MLKRSGPSGLPRRCDHSRAVSKGNATMDGIHRRARRTAKAKSRSDGAGALTRSCAQCPLAWSGCSPAIRLASIFIRRTRCSCSSTMVAWCKQNSSCLPRRLVQWHKVRHEPMQDSRLYSTVLWGLLCGSYCVHKAREDDDEKQHPVHTMQELNASERLCPIGKRTRACSRK